MTMTRESDGAHIPGSVSDIAPVAPVIEGRSLRRIAWNRLKKDKLALSGGVVVILLILAAILAPPLSALSGNRPGLAAQQPDRPGLPDPVRRHRRHQRTAPARRRAWPTAATSSAGSSTARVSRCIASAVHAGGRSSIGTVLGLVAGFFGGWVDAVISRLMDVFLAFPLLLFASRSSASCRTTRSASPARRCASRCWSSSSASSTGPTSAASSAARRSRCASASSWTPRAASAPGPATSCSRELLPNLVAPILVYSTLLIPTNILFEAGALASSASA